MKEDAEKLQEIVVIGYGTVLKDDMTGSISAIKAEDLNRGAVVSTQDLLKGKAGKWTISAKDKNVVVVGGGDTGNDCVGTCIRQGCKSITQLEMMARPPKERQQNNPWPEWPKVLKTDYGQEESIAVFGKDPRVYLTTVKSFVRDDEGRLELTLYPTYDRTTEAKILWIDNCTHQMFGEFKG